MLKISKKIIFSGVIGNTFEMYDYVIWSLFSSYLAMEFLPQNSNFSDIFLLFLITYFVRPIGSFFFGILSDQIGRKKTLMYCMVIMGGCTGIVSILPSYKEIGVLSTIILFMVRLIQVSAIGGEYIGSVSLLIESCEQKSKGYFGSWAAAGINIGILLSSVIGVIFSYLIEEKIIPGWGWRIVFFISFITALVGLWIRTSIPEGIEFIKYNARINKRTMKEISKKTILSIKTHCSESIVAFSLVLFGVSSTFLFFIYSPIYMSHTLKFLNWESFLINSLGLLLLISLIPVFGWLSDKYGRMRFLFFSIVILSIISVPYFFIIHSFDFTQMLISQLIISIPCACIFSIIPVFITEIFNISIRCSTLSLIYSLGSCLGGGIAPLLAFELEKPRYITLNQGSILLLLGFFALSSLFIFRLKKLNSIPIRLLSDVN